MSGTPSFERFDYLLRTNKHIERKLVFDVLDSAAQKIGFGDHWYLGFGSMWFGDFRLAHRRLGIDSMVSVEYSDYASRAEFNRPFAGVTVEPGDCNVVMANMAVERWSKPVIAWLDYDGHLNDEVVKDIDIILSRAQPNSVVLITVNGARGTYRVRKPDGKIEKQETSVGVVAGFLGDGSIPTRFEPQPTGKGTFRDIPEAVFPEFLSEAIASYMEHQVVTGARESNGKRIKFIPLYRLHHRDGADMVTVGGALVTDDTEAIWLDSLARQPLLYGETGQTSYCRLDLVPVTVKEKIALDGCLPDIGDGTEFLAAARACGIALADAELTKYRKFYRHFPVFVETTM
ncbi:hypothetical protein KAK06_02450 [Ideonella sp. 4Y11]|uniref:Uncharacterized protein n=1 Tax=Ideonella aquatica TaxID=2824119 RepID=A0A941BIG1_9BURK|nr:O-methyltransferase [Ideonella aquatica]MBQ0957808.1 hypothetical protein [Ideonella aquatica]